MDKQLVIFMKPSTNGSSLLNTMKGLYDDNQFTDIKLNVGGTIFPAHKPVLYHNSPILKGLLTAETKDKYKEVIDLHGVSIRYFKELLLYMYTEKLEIHPGNILGIISVADYLQMEDVKRFCLSTLPNFLTSEKSVEYFQAGHLYNDKVLMENTASCICDDLPQVQSALNLCSFDVFKEIFNNTPKRNDDFQRYMCIKQWVDCDVPNRKQHFEQLIGSFDFEKMSNVDLGLMIADGMVKDHPKIRESISDTLTRSAIELEKWKSKILKTFHGKLEWTFSDVSKMKTSYFVVSGDAYKYIAGFKWGMSIRKTVTDGVEGLNFFCDCHSESDESDWSCNAKVTYTLCSSRAGGDMIEVENCKFYGEDEHWSLAPDNFFKWEDIMNPENGCLSPSGEITLQLEIEVVDIN